MGWSTFGNGELLKAAEADFEVLVTTDRNLRHQQNLAGKRLAVLVLPTTSWPRIEVQLSDVVAALRTIRPGEIVELKFSN
jgi:hypothetical protein